MLSYYLLMVETDKDRDKVTYIYENFYTYMEYMAAQELKGKEHMVQDAVHTAIITIIENLQTVDFSDDKRLKNFCGTVAKNKAKDMCKLKRNNSVQLDDAVFHATEEMSDPAEITIKKDTIETVVQAIYSLNESYRDICILKYLEGFKEREISEMLKIPHKTVSVRLVRARQILKKALTEEGLHV